MDWDRFVDRDMLMRYYFGFGVGHTYFWSEGSQDFEDDSPRSEREDEQQEEEPEGQEVAAEEEDDFGSVNSMDRGSEPEEEPEGEVVDDVEDESDDDEFHARYEMYHGV